MPRAAPLPRHAGHDRDPERHLRQPLLRHPLRHARHHPRGAAAHGPALAVLGVRLRDGAEVGAHAACARRRCRSASSRIARGASATTSARAGSRPGRRPGSTCARCSSTAPNFFLFKPGPAAAGAGPGADAAAVVRAGHASGPITFSLHWMLLGLSLAIARAAVRVHGHPVAGVLRLRRRRDGALVPALPVQPDRSACRRRCSRPGVVLGGLLTVNYVRNGFRLHGGLAGQQPGRDRHPVRGVRLHDVHVHAAAALDGGRRQARGDDGADRQSYLQDGARHAGRSVRRLAVGAADPARRAHLRGQAGGGLRLRFPGVVFAHDRRRGRGH